MAKKKATKKAAPKKKAPAKKKAEAEKPAAAPAADAAPAKPKADPNVAVINGTKCKVAVFLGEGPAETHDGLVLVHGSRICIPIDSDAPRFSLSPEEWDEATKG